MPDVDNLRLKRQLSEGRRLRRLVVCVRAAGEVQVARLQGSAAAHVVALRRKAELRKIRLSPFMTVEQLGIYQTQPARVNQHVHTDKCRRHGQYTVDSCPIFPKSAQAALTVHLAAAHAAFTNQGYSFPA